MNSDERATTCREMRHCRQQVQNSTTGKAETRAKRMNGFAEMHSCEEKTYP
jgi:hypothetical protein